MHNSVKILQVIETFVDCELIKEIWEIGSRDGLDSLEMVKTFPNAQITAFEPNPTTFDSLQKISDFSSGKIKAKQFALSDRDDESMIFYMVDTQKSITSWSDGNPGASSLFPAINSIGGETYIQIPINVKSYCPLTLIDKMNYPVPNLIWIDCQGAEELIFRGFGAYLGEIDFLYVELSIKELYFNQALALDVINLLSSSFYWHSNLYVGELQLDAIFINKKHKTKSLYFRNKLLYLSIKVLVLIGERKPRLKIDRLISNLSKKLAVFLLNYL
jgi:FkbM family methyltransferase